MAITRIKGKQLEASTNPGSLLASDTSNNYVVVTPTLGADHLWFYDHSATALVPLIVGTNLSITGTTLNASAGAGGYTTAQEEGVTVGASNTTLNFIGSGLTAADAGAGVTSVTVASFLNTLATAGAVSLTAHVSGVLPVANGGTGIASGTSGGVLYYSAAGTLASSAALTDNVLVVGGGAGVTPNSLTAGLGTTTTVLHGNAAGEPTWGAISLTADVSGTLPVANGGTGAATLTGLLQGNGTSAITAITNSSTVGQVLRVTGASTYAWGALDLADTDAVTGVLDETNGGTGQSTISTGDILYGSSSNTLSKLTIGAASTYLKGGTTPSWATLNIAALSDGGTIATQTYVNNLIAGIRKGSVRAATTVAGTLATSFENGDVIDGVTLATGDLILIKDQAAQAENGVYTVNVSGAPTRATWMDAASEIDGVYVAVEDGTTLAGTLWITVSEVTTLNTDAIVFTQIQTAGTLTGSGVNNQIAVWAGTSSLDGNTTFTWDQTQMTVGTATPASSSRVTTQGTGTGNTTYGLVHNNSSATQVFRVADDGTTVIGSTNQLSITSSTISRATGGIDITATNSTGNINIESSASSGIPITLKSNSSAALTPGIRFQTSFSSNAATHVEITNGLSRTFTSGNALVFSIPSTYSPTSGTGTDTTIKLTKTINQTGGASGIVRDLHITPTLTAAADYRAIEVTANSSHYALYTTAGKVRHDLGSDATGDTWYRGAGGEMTRLAAGATSGHVLTSNGSGAAPSWQATAAATAVTRAYLTGSTSSVIDLDSGTAVTDVDGSNITFTVPSDLDKTFVVRNGVTLSRSGTVSRDYTLVSATGVLTLASALTSDESLMVYKIV